MTGLSGVLQLGGAHGAGLSVAVAPDLDPQLATADGLWRASAVDPGWTAADPWANEGTAGSALDLHSATDEGLVGEVADGVGTVVTVDHLVTPVLVDGGFDIGHNAGDADDGANDFGFYGDFAMDLSGPFAVTVDYTPDAIGVTSMRYLRRGFPFGHPGFVFEEAVMFGGFIAAAIDGDNFVYSPPTIEGFLAINPVPAIAGRQQFTLGYDGSAFIAYRNGVPVDGGVFPPFDDAGVDLPLIVGPGQTVHNIAFHKGAAVEALDPPALQAALGAL